VRRVQELDEEATRLEGLVARHGRPTRAVAARIGGGGRLRCHGHEIIILAKHMR
jgi:hypothetical protein